MKLFNQDGSFKVKIKKIAVLVGMVMSGFATAYSAHANLHTSNVDFGTISSDAFFEDFVTINKTPGGYTNFSHTYSLTLDANAFQVTGNAKVNFNIRPGGSQLYGISNFGIYFGGSGFPTTVTLLDPNDNLDSFTGDILLNPGIYTYTIVGNLSGSAGGKYSYAVSALPVPEAETWAMMLAGLGLVGMQLRRKSKAAKQISVN